MGFIVFVLAVVIVFLSDSKTALGLALISPFLASLIPRLADQNPCAESRMIISASGNPAHES